MDKKKPDKKPPTFEDLRVRTDRLILRRLEQLDREFVLVPVFDLVNGRWIKSGVCTGRLQRAA